MATRRRNPNASAPTDGSRTITVHDAQPQPEGEDSEAPDRAIPVEGTLTLTGGPRSQPRVAWDAAVIDNENCGKKKSKICCIYHKPREFDESSSDESSSDDSGSEASDDGRARPPQNRRPRHHHHHHDHSHEPNDGGSMKYQDDEGGVYELEKEEPNAYEKQPQSKKGKGRVQN
ncbi:hypothetical protein M422DRAFT_234614 [Sphaerobolus stellatus SS14]|uniref:Type 1 phosphatases regulator n=1 Tax=Sphaerobolus stellatus (strain SS14) TaxID=990650 RepID=A0A0C9U9N4_SPHS4|nr:hypothetical protein M422DRAFT_234614 [Sphaerobolus stellatus SS14]